MLSDPHGTRVVLSRLLEGKVTFEPDLTGRAYIIRATITPGRVVEYVSPTVPSWNQLLAWLREMALLRRAEAA